MVFILFGDNFFRNGFVGLLCSPLCFVQTGTHSNSAPSMTPDHKVFSLCTIPLNFLLMILFHPVCIVEASGGCYGSILKSKSGLCLWFPRDYCLREIPNRLR